MVNPLAMTPPPQRRKALRIFPADHGGVSEIRSLAYLLIVIAGFLGANTRSLVARWITERFGATYG
jgi:hypothetical protein